MDNLPKVLIDFVWNLPEISENLYKSAELLKSDPGQSGQLLGEALGKFLHKYDPELLAAPQPLALPSPLNFTEGLITGL